MKSYLFLFALLLSITAGAQTGGLHIRCIDQQTAKSFVADVEIVRDSLLQLKETDEQGRTHFSRVPSGPVWVVVKKDEELLAKQQVFIQSKQVLQVILQIDKNGVSSSGKKGTEFDLGNGGEEIALNVSGSGRRTSANKSSTQNSSGISVSVAPGVQNLQEVNCVAVVRSNSSIRLSGANMAMISQQDLNHMPMRSVNGIASTTGGVIQNELNQDLYVRGARANANAYYIDGMRVTDVYGMPKSSINQVTVINGGIPANYGDVTGGVIAVETKSYLDVERERSSASFSRGYRPTRRSNTPVRSYEPKPALNLDRFASIYENDFLSSVAHPNSTFGIDVDRASWTYIKRRFEKRATISRDAVKLEEIINAFNYSDVEVPENELMHVKLERALCSWNDSSELVVVQLKATDLPKDVKRKPHNFVFLIDVSGSMSSHDKIYLIKDGLAKFVRTLNEDDRVAIVTYAGSAGVLLEPTMCTDKERILTSIEGLTSGGSTYGIGGVQSAYELAEENYDPELNNRIILCTDGDFNVGINNTGDLEKYIAQKRGKGIYLTALGFGMGNYRNDVLETLADRGDGNHFYINNLKEMNSVLVEQIGNLINIARDVKLNVEFNPKLVTEYRLIGYENRMLKPKDFTDDTKDAGEIGYNHTVTAVYEIKPGKSEKETSHFTKTKINAGKKELAFVRLRYKSFEDSASVERRYSLSAEEPLKEHEQLNVVVGFGLLLRDSVFKGAITEKQLKKMAGNLSSKDKEIKDLKAMIAKL